MVITLVITIVITKTYEKIYNEIKKGIQIQLFHYSSEGGSKRVKMERAPETCGDL